MISTKSHERRKVAMGKSKKVHVLYLVIASAALVIVVLLVALFMRNSHIKSTSESQTKTTTTATSSSSSSNQQYIKDRDYTEEYLDENMNKLSITKDKLNTALDKLGVHDYDSIIGQYKFDKNVVPKIEIFYNQDLNWLGVEVWRFNEDGNVPARPYKTLFYSLDDYKVVENALDKRLPSEDHNELPIYKWVNHYNYK